jgi:hypothetical protein
LGQQQPSRLRLRGDDSAQGPAALARAPLD